MSKIFSNEELKQFNHLIYIGILGALIILVGDLIMGWGLKDLRIQGIESQIIQYRDVSDIRMIIASICGFSGVPVAVIGHYAIYKILKAYDVKEAKLYLLGMLGFLAFGGAGVHVSSIELAYFYKYMTLANSSIVLSSTLKYAAYFVLPLYLVLIICWILMVYAHIKVILKANSPFPKIFILSSMIVGTMVASLIGLLGNHEIINALMVGAFSLGNIWTLVAHLLILPKLNKLD